MAVSSCVTSVVPPHTLATPLTPMMTTCPPAMTQAVRPETQTITVTLPLTPLATADGIADQRRHWWHIEEVKIPFRLPVRTNFQVIQHNGITQKVELCFPP